jgi:serine O-acetyltransferase
MLLYTKIYRPDVSRSQILLASSPLEPCNPLQRAQGLTKVFTPVKLFFDLVAQDAKAYGRERPSILFYIVALLGLSRFSAVLLHRVDSALSDKGFPWSALSKLASRWNCLWNSCELSPYARIGPGLHLPHPTGVIVGTIIAGRNLTIHQNVSIGLKDLDLSYLDHRSFPCFGDDVTVCANATVLGSIVIGDAVVIGASAVVLNDVPTGSRAVGNPARVLPPRTTATRRTASLQA